MWQLINDGRPVLTFSAESIVLDNSSHDIEIDDVIEEEMFLAEIYDEDGCEWLGQLNSKAK